MLLRVTALYSIYHFVCQEAIISRGISVRAQISPSLQDESRSLFNGCENQSKKIHTLFAIYEPLLEYETIEKSIEKYIKRFC